MVCRFSLFSAIAFILLLLFSFKLQAEWQPVEVQSAGLAFSMPENRTCVKERMQTVFNECEIHVGADEMGCAYFAVMARTCRPIDLPSLQEGFLQGFISGGKENYKISAKETIFKKMRAMHFQIRREGRLLQGYVFLKGAWACFFAAESPADEYDAAAVHRFFDEVAQIKSN